MDILGDPHSRGERPLVFFIAGGGSSPVLIVDQEPLTSHSYGEHTRRRSKKGSGSSINLINDLLQLKLSRYMSPQISSTAVLAEPWWVHS